MQSTSCRTKYPRYTDNPSPEENPKRQLRRSVWFAHGVVFKEANNLFREKVKQKMREISIPYTSDDIDISSPSASKHLLTQRSVSETLPSESSFSCGVVPDSYLDTHMRQTALSEKDSESTENSQKDKNLGNPTPKPSQNAPVYNDDENLLDDLEF